MIFKLYIIDLYDVCFLLLPKMSALYEPWLFPDLLNLFLLHSTETDYRYIQYSPRYMALLARMYSFGVP